MIHTGVDGRMSRGSRQDWQAADLPQRLGLGVIAAIALLLFWVLLKLLLPWLLAIAVVGGAWYGWQRYRRFQQQLYQCFYDCLRVNQGRIRVLEFAMAAQIPGPQARAFLDARARDFFADFEPSLNGDICYTFSVPSSVSEVGEDSRHR